MCTTRSSTSLFFFSNVVAKHFIIVAYRLRILQRLLLTNRPMDSSKFIDSERKQDLSQELNPIFFAPWSCHESYQCSCGLKNYQFCLSKPFSTRRFTDSRSKMNIPQLFSQDSSCLVLIIFKSLDSRNESQESVNIIVWYFAFSCVTQRGKMQMKICLK